MSGPVAVIGLDAADYRLVREWGLDSLLGDQHTALEVPAVANPYPHTFEVWPTIATGLEPDEHGLLEEEQSWDNPVLRAASTLTKVLPKETRKRLGAAFRSDDSGNLTNPMVDHEDVFRSVGGVVRWWPGATPAEHISRTWWAVDQRSKNELTSEEFDQTVRNLWGEEFGWLLSHSESDIPVAAIHSHVLDGAGHAYANDELALRDHYRTVARHVGYVLEEFEQVVIVSDHGMQTTWLDDADVGEHSFEAYIATKGIDKPLPTDALDVHDWLQDLVSPTATNRSQLSSLGYLSE